MGELLGWSVLTVCPHELLYIKPEGMAPRDKTNQQRTQKTVPLATGDVRGGQTAAAPGAKRASPGGDGHTGVVKPQCNHAQKLQKEAEKEECPG
jgi:hypothetical protein